MASSMDGVETTKLLKAKDFKAQGTQLLNEGKFKDANDMYQKILDTLGGKEMGHHETERKDLIQVLKFIYSEKATKFREIFTFLLTSTT